MNRTPSVRQGSVPSTDSCVPPAVMSAPHTLVLTVVPGDSFGQRLELRPERRPYSHATVTEPLPTACANPDGSSMRPSRV